MRQSRIWSFLWSEAPSWHVRGGVVLVCVLEEEMEGRARGVGSRPGVLKVFLPRELPFTAAT